MAKVICRHLDTTQFSDVPVDTGEDQVYIWVISISASMRLIDRLSSILSADELVRAGRYHHDRDRRRFEVSRIALRLILGGMLNQHPGEIVFSVSDNKKPFVAGSPLQYNISHAGDMILIAVSRYEVGVDVEKIDYDFDGSDVLHACFSKAAQDFISESEDPQATFYRFWTRKEAIQKATGRGIDDDILNVPCLDGTYIRAGKTDIVVSSFMLGGENTYTGSVATSALCQCVFISGDAWIQQRIDNYL